MPDCKPQGVILYVSGKTLEAGQPVHKHSTYFCKPKTIACLALHVFIQMVLKTLFCSFFRARNCQRVARLLDFNFLCTSYHNGKIASDPTQRQTFLEIRETCSGGTHRVQDAHSNPHMHYAAPFYSQSTQKD